MAKVDSVERLITGEKGAGCLGFAPPEKMLDLL